ncbi:MAG: GNAT family N-acetyltransferase [Bosea sp. (in: a-proteobacteria)]
MPEFTIRDATAEDAPAMSALINEIIRAGGTTAHQTLFDEARFLDHYVDGPKVRSCLVAVSPVRQIVAFQAISVIVELPPDWGDIATFARATSRQSGVGTAMFALTRRKAVGMGLFALNATIRADNLGGQAYYAKMGFEIYDTQKAVPLRDGTKVDRISRRFALV